MSLYRNIVSTTSIGVAGAISTTSSVGEVLVPDGFQALRAVASLSPGSAYMDLVTLTDREVITSRNPRNLEAFSAKIIEEIKEGLHSQRSAA